jgi:hypothetical protein
MFKMKESNAAGSMYSMDLFGGCIAAISGSTVIIGNWGLEGMFLFIFLIKVISTKWWVRQEYKISVS